MESETNEVSYTGLYPETQVPYKMTWQRHAQWHDSCANCGCVANWHRFDIPAGATMVALPEKFPCAGFEFGGCPQNCENYEFRAHAVWQMMSDAGAPSRAARHGGSDG